MRIGISIYSKAGWPGINRIDRDWNIQYHKIKVRNLIKFLSHYKPDKWRLDILPLWSTFFTFFCKQNDYLFPHKGCPEEYKSQYHFSKPHWWKTRIGFKTAWDLAKTIHK